jgi:hypothetical protein
MIRDHNTGVVLPKIMSVFQHYFFVEYSKTDFDEKLDEVVKKEEEYFHR